MNVSHMNTTLLILSLKLNSALDRWKNVMGRMQHYWLVFACDKLGLTRFLLPLLTKKAVVSAATYSSIRINAFLCLVLSAHHS